MNGKKKGISIHGSDRDHRFIELVECFFVRLLIHVVWSLDHKVTVVTSLVKKRASHSNTEQYTRMNSKSGSVSVFLPCVPLFPPNLHDLPSQQS